MNNDISLVKDVQRIQILSNAVSEYAGAILHFDTQVNSLQNQLKNESSKVPPALKKKCRYVEVETGKTYEFDGITWQEVTKPDATPVPS